MTSTAESKRFFKNHKLHKKKEDERKMYVCFSLIWPIYIYIYNSFRYSVRRQKLLGNIRSGSTALSYRNCVITSVWWLMKARYRTCFHTLYDEINDMYTGCPRQFSWSYFFQPAAYATHVITLSSSMNTSVLFILGTGAFLVIFVPSVRQMLKRIFKSISNSFLILLHCFFWVGQNFRPCFNESI